MAITQTISNLPPAPQSTDPSNFRTKADAFVSALNTFEDELNLAIPQMNALETNVNNKEASATSSALVCTSAANFQGTWTNQTTVVGQSWAYNGLVYLVLVAGNTSPTTSPSNWMSLGIDAQTHAATSKTTPVDADELPIVDSASSFSLKKLTWGNLKATLKAYFDGIYANLSSPALTGTPTAPTATAGNNTTQLATTAMVHSAITNDFHVTGTAPMYACRAWLNYDGVTPTIRASGNVSSVTKNGTGDYTVNFTTAMPDTNYSAIGTVKVEDNNTMGSNSNSTICGTAVRTTSSVEFFASNTSAAKVDVAIACIAIFR
jgi:hypothetical protein